MKQSEGFLKVMRTPDTYELLTTRPKEFHLLILIALTLNRDGSHNLCGSQIGESRVTPKMSKLTPSQFRTAKKNLQRMGLAVFVTRGKGKGMKMYARLTNTLIFDPNVAPKEHSLDPDNAQKNAKTILFQSKTCKKTEQEKTTGTDTQDIANLHTNSYQNDKEQEEKKKRRNKLPPASEESLRLANLLYESIKKTHPHAKKPSHMGTWAIEIDRINTIDGKSIEEIESIIDYLPHDAFWCNNILSGNKLRKQFGKLEEAKFESKTKKTSLKRFQAKIEWAKQQLLPIREREENAFFSFREDFVIIGDKRHNESTYSEIYFTPHGFEEQITNALMKWGFR